MGVALLYKILPCSKRGKLIGGKDISDKTSHTCLIITNYTNSYFQINFCLKRNTLYSLSPLSKHSGLLAFLVRQVTFCSITEIPAHGWNPPCTYPGSKPTSLHTHFALQLPLGQINKCFSVVELFVYPSWKCHYPMALSKSYRFVFVFTSQPGLNFPVCCFLGMSCVAEQSLQGFRTASERCTWAAGGHIRLLQTAKFHTAPAACDFSSTHKWGIVARRAQTVFFKLKEIIYLGWFFLFFHSPNNGIRIYYLKNYIFFFRLTASNDCGVIIKHFINNNVTFLDCVSD